MCLCVRLLLLDGNGFWPVFGTQYPLCHEMVFVNLIFSKWPPTWPLYSKWPQTKVRFSIFRQDFLHTVSSKHWLRAHEFVFSKWLPTWPPYSIWLLTKAWFLYFDGIFCIQYLLDISSKLMPLFDLSPAGQIATGNDASKTYLFSMENGGITSNSLELPVTPCSYRPL